MKVGFYILRRLLNVDKWLKGVNKDDFYSLYLWTYTSVGESFWASGVLYTSDGDRIRLSCLTGALVCKSVINLTEFANLRYNRMKHFLSVWDWYATFFLFPFLWAKNCDRKFNFFLSLLFFCHNGWQSVVIDSVVNLEVYFIQNVESIRTETVKVS